MSKYMICFLRELDLPIDAISQILKEEHPEKVISLFVFGHLYRKHGIQYSMMAHAGAHVVWKLIWIVLL